MSAGQKMKQGFEKEWSGDLSRWVTLKRWPESRELNDVQGPAIEHQKEKPSWAREKQCKTPKGKMSLLCWKNSKEGHLAGVWQAESRGDKGCHGGNQRPGWEVGVSIWASQGDFRGY